MAVIRSVLNTCSSHDNQTQDTFIQMKHVINDQQRFSHILLSQILGVEND